MNTEVEASYRNENGTLVTVEWVEAEDGNRIPQVRLTVSGFTPDKDEHNAYLQLADLERIKTIAIATVLISGQLS